MYVFVFIVDIPSHSLLAFLPFLPLHSSSKFYPVNFRLRHVCQASFHRITNQRNNGGARSAPYLYAHGTHRRTGKGQHPLHLPWNPTRR
ncbi:hypothetical protein I7I53_06918 [Histoplasma capsulatum var. duboisii H88]|uniref:Uncharacterized protein n=1 Tax=Ajellomyces capsulatus (strain H88) TaxID=544711 RepID=A0A8A1LCR5_AJEC8|nr:hypothetical protein I7I53_06918 [Histoplasma capsulatum var. duboisii H88]